MRKKVNTDTEKRWGMGWLSVN